MTVDEPSSSFTGFVERRSLSRTDSFTSSKPLQLPLPNKVFPSALLYAGGMLDLFITMARAGSALLFGLFVALSSNLSEKCRWRGGPSLPKMKTRRLLEGHSTTYSG